MNGPSFAGLCCTVLLCAPASGAEWEKYRQTVADPTGGPVLATFTTIVRRDLRELRPMRARYLYQDDAGRLLVVREEASVEPPWTSSIECLPSGETLVFEVTPRETATLRFGNRALAIRVSEIDPEADGLSPVQFQRAAAVIEGMSSDCRDALRRFAEVGTCHSTALHDRASVMALYLFPDLAPRTPDPDATSPPGDVVRPFDPAQVPPDPFEVRFGDAYFR